MQEKVRAWTPVYLLYAGTIFAGAFLIFAIQPIAGKYILPWFGGSSSVWATGLFFFTGMLFVGYLYVYLLTRYGGRRQALIHTIVLLILTLPVLFSFLMANAQFPALGWTIGNTHSPALNVLLALFAAVGPPYFLLATTGPLLQYWYGTSVHREPYRFYVLSNIASLLALLSYPFIVEPFIALHLQIEIWVALFFIYICSYAVISILASRGSATSRDTDFGEKVRANEWLQWTALAALPTFLLVATTTQITQTVAPVPLLWIIPLAIYLCTLIIAFAGWGGGIYTPLLLLITAALAYFNLSDTPYSIVWKMSSFLLLLFFCGLCAHARVYALRPATARLPLFYLFVAFGGMIGTLLASIVAPLIFTDLYEFPLGVALCAILAMSVLSTGFFPRMLDDRKIFLTRMIGGLFAATLFLQIVLGSGAIAQIVSRNFYGSVAVRFDTDNGLVELMHGTTMHGVQLMDPAGALQPTTYYTAGSGVGRAMQYEQTLRPTMRAGLIGLGAGTLAAYCRPKDTFVFYEIDPRIVQIAHSYFSYLQECPNASVHVGDARILLEQEKSSGKLGDYDLLVVDAFTDDTIPVHLLTLQAMELYRSHLHGRQSIIAVHTSNRYLDLVPVVLRLAAQSGLDALVVGDSGEKGYGVPSIWVILTQDGTVFASKSFAGAQTWLPKASTQLWTDDYTSLWPILNLPLPWKNN